MSDEVKVGQVYQRLADGEKFEVTDIQQGLVKMSPTFGGFPVVMTISNFTRSIPAGFWTLQSGYPVSPNNVVGIPYNAASQLPTEEPTLEAGQVWESANGENIFHIEAIEGATVTWRRNGEYLNQQSDLASLTTYVKRLGYRLRGEQKAAGHTCEFVNVGFTSLKMVCKHCDAEEGVK